MRARIAITTVAVLFGTLTACGSGDTSNPAPKDDTPKASATPTGERQTGALDAEAVATELQKTVPSLKVTVVYTEASDPNHQLGRPGGYTSKVTFSDSRIPAKEVEFTDEHDLTRGGSVEVFDTAAAAEKRAAYIRKIGESMPTFAEYDYVQGPVLLRVSKILTPTQAKEYEQALAELS